MHFGRFREYSIKIVNDKKSYVCLPENVGCIPLVVVIKTTANGMHPTFFGNHIQLFIISDLDRSLPTFHGDRRNPLDLCYVMFEVLQIHCQQVRLRTRATVLPQTPLAFYPAVSINGMWKTTVDCYEHTSYIQHSFYNISETFVKMQMRRSVVKSGYSSYK